MAFTAGLIMDWAYWIGQIDRQCISLAELKVLIYHYRVR